MVVSLEVKLLEIRPELCDNGVLLLKIKLKCFLLES